MSSKAEEVPKSSCGSNTSIPQAKEKKNRLVLLLNGVLLLTTIQRKNVMEFVP